jgi:methionyl aminopeptidase
MIIRKSPSELQKMRASGQLVARILQELTKTVQVGITTQDLEVAAERMINDAGARPAFKGYYVPAAGRRFPCVLCTSVNDEVIHGIPSKKRVLREGDIVKIDIGVQLDGYFGDSATTVPVGKIAPETERLLRVTQESLQRGIEQMVAGRKLFDVSDAVQKHVEENGFSVVREFVGHGIGTKLHEEPAVPNYVDSKVSNPRLRPGIVLAVEPMVAAGRGETKVLQDRWTAVTVDGSASAHFEHCVAVTDNGPWVLTEL